MDGATLASFWTSKRARVDLPAPEGEESTSISPRRPAIAASLDILNLLAELIDYRLHLEADPGKRAVARLGAERVYFPIQLLREEVETPPDRTTGREQGP